MQAIIDFVQSNQQYISVAHALAAILSIIGWTLGLILITVAWRRNSIRTVSVGPFEFQIQDAVTATAAAARSWQPQEANRKRLDVGKIRDTVAKAFQPGVADALVGKAVLWVDDNPNNNFLAVRALGKLRLDIEQVTNTDAALAHLRNRNFDLVISDMGRGANMRAGYDLLERIRADGHTMPFFIFAGSDTPEFRREAAARGAQLSTNDMLELIDATIEHLSPAK